MILDIEDVPREGPTMPTAAVYPPESPPGPAGRWLIGRLQQCANSIQKPV